MREHSWKKLLVHGYEYSRMPTVVQQAVETIEPILSMGITVGAQRRRRAPYPEPTIVCSGTTY
jgi:hypothetical protein